MLRLSWLDPVVWDSNSFVVLSCSLERTALAKTLAGICVSGSVGVETAESGPVLSEGVGDPGF